MFNKSSYRHIQVTNAVRNALTKILTHGTFLDHYLNGLIITITHLEMSKDLKVVDCYIMPLLDADIKPEDLANNIARYKSLIKQELNAQVKLRYAPDLRFFIDQGWGNARKVDEVYEKHLEGTQNHHKGDS